ncbi:MAG: hypothetical protein JNK61_07000 [Bacteroidia bacterium]|nr:hypothetical protein [Bacteroidia bacterium]
MHYTLTTEEMNKAYACAVKIKQHGSATIITDHIEAVQCFLWDMMKMKTKVWQRLQFQYEKKDEYFIEQC